MMKFDERIAEDLEEFLEKSRKKVLTKWRRSDIITKLSARATSSVERLKKLKKVLENPLTKRQQSDIINKLSTERLQRVAH